EARRRDAGRGDRDDGINLVRFAICLREHAAGRRFEQIDRRIEVDLIAFGPLVEAFVPSDWHARIAPIDSGIAEDGKQAHDLRRARAERELDAPHYLGLTELERRHGGRNAQYTSVLRDAGNAPSLRQGPRSPHGNGLPPVSWFRPIAAAFLAAVLLGAG